MDIIKFSAPEIGGIAKIIYWLVGICGAVWLGVILFTLILKIITMPFDYVSRASMRKNSLKMEEMRPELEKLQRQYAGNKDLYNQKMMALYKKNGYSMFGACLPTILTLVIFIVAINAFTSYSNFQNKQYFYNMSNSYNNVAYAGFEINDDKTYIYRNENGEFIVNYDEIIKADTDNDKKIVSGEGDNQVIIYFENSADNILSDGSVDGKIFSLWTENGYSKYERIFRENNGQLEWATDPKYSIIEEKLSDEKTLNKLASEENNFLKVNIEGNLYYYSELDKNTWTKEKFMKDIQQEMSAKTYRNEEQSFLWVKNIWVTDSPFEHPIEEDYAKFKSTHDYDGLDISGDYENLIAKLEKEQTAANGYFILIILTAGTSLLMQIIMGKSQKAQMELQTVDGQGAQTQKMMQWMMPIMMAVFAFMYTAAFSLYIIVNTILSMGSTFGINFIVDRKIKKEKKKQPEKKLRGRVYVPKEEPKKEEPKKEKVDKNDRFAHEGGGDFLKGPVKKGKKKN